MSLYLWNNIPIIIINLRIAYWENFLKITFWKVSYFRIFCDFVLFFKNFWLCKPIENCLCIICTRYEYLKHATRSRNVAHFELWPYDQQIGLWSRKSGSRVDFLKSYFGTCVMLQNILWFCIIFYKIFDFASP